MSESGIQEEDGVEVENIEIDSNVEEGVGDIEGTGEGYDPENVVVTVDGVEVESVEESRELTHEDFNMEMSKADEIQLEARVLYAKMQQSWFWFAKKIAEIQSTSIYEGMGYKNFKEYCDGEFPELDYPQMSKMVRLVSEMGGAIEAYITKNPDKSLPAKESLYRLQVAKDKAEKNDDLTGQRKVAGLITQVMEGDMSYYRLIEELKGVGASKPIEVVEASTPATEKIGEEVEIEHEGEVEVSENDEDDGEVDRIAESVELAISPLRDNIQSLVAALEEDSEKFSSNVKSVVDKLDDFHDEINELLNKIVAITAVDAGEEVN